MSLTQWLSAKPKSSTTSHTNHARFTQEKLIFPGEAGSGIATPKEATRGSRQAGSASNIQKGRPSIGTLDSFLRPRNASTPSQSKSSNRARTTASKGKAALAFAPASDSHKNKEVVVHVVEDESQVEFLGCNSFSSPNKQQQRHNNTDATTTSSSDAEPGRCSNRSECLPAKEEAIPQPEKQIVQKPSAPLALPPMPLPMPQFLRSMFGFGELPPPPKTEEPTNKRKRKRAVVESSSPVKSTTLAGPSSPAFSSRSDSVDPMDLNAGFLAEETEHPPRTLHVLKSPDNVKCVDRVVGHGDRIAWGTQDESEYRRLNRTESERLIDEQLVVRWAPREAPPATQERTDYMDRFRSESYSPVQYTATEGQMNEFRRRMGLSPIQRLPSQGKHHTSPSHKSQTRVLPMMELDEEATQISFPPSQHRSTEESFDESATQQSTCSSPLSEAVLGAIKIDRKADDSGFVSSSPRSKKEVSSPAGDIGLRDALSKAKIGASDSGLLSSPPVLHTSLLSNDPKDDFPAKIDSLAVHTGLKESLRGRSASFSESEEGSDFDEATVVSKPRERRILALATQETQDVETQFIRIQETQLVLCSQEESSELDLDIDMTAEAPTVETETVKGAHGATCGKRVSTVTRQIDAAWFPQILQSATEASSAKANQQEQSFLTDFFGRKPGGPAAKAAAEREAREKEFVNAIVKERRESRQSKPILEALVEGEDDDIEAVLDNDDQEPETTELDNVAEVEDSETEEMMMELESQTKMDVKLPCEGWVLGQKRHKTPTPVKQYRYRQF